MRGGGIRVAVGLLATLTGTLAGCTPPAASLHEALSPGRVELVDLTHPLDGRTLVWPTSPVRYQHHRIHHGKTAAGFFYADGRFCSPEHGGTHMDAPIHFAEGRASTDRVPLGSLMAPAVVLDVTAAAARDPDYRLTVDDIRADERRHGVIPAGAIVVLRTGWSTRWPDRRSYFGDDTPGDASRLHFPSFGAEAARYLVEVRRVAGIGVDTASIDHGPSKDFPVHRVVNGANLPGFENLARLDRLPPRGAFLVALPLKIVDGSGGPIRAVALVPR
jgi:kynurenine formamidase